MRPVPAAVVATALGCFAAVALTACSGLGSQPVRTSGAAYQITLPAVRTPTDRGMPVGVAAVTAQRVFVASDTAHPVSTSNGVVMTGSGLISFTTNSGRSWKTVWSRRGLYLGWMGVTGSKVVATGTQYPTSGLGSEYGSPVLLMGNEDGGNWRVVHPSGLSQDGAWGTAAVDWVSSTLALASTSPSYIGSIPQPLMISRDGGASWSAVHLPGGTSTGGISAPSASTLFATGTVTSPTRTCDGAVWESTDAGLDWSMLPGSCSPAPLYSVQFLSSRIGFAGGGNLPMYSQPPGRVLLATTDGGTVWSIASQQTTSSQLASPIVELNFITSEAGTLLTGGCGPGANGPCGGHVYTTADGGRSLHRTAQLGTALTTVGTHDLWVLDYPGSQVSVSDDAGGKWRVLPGLGAARIGALAFQSGSLILTAAAGTYTSSDGGRRWAYVGGPEVAGFAPPNTISLKGDALLIEPAMRTGQAKRVRLAAAAQVGLSTVVFAAHGRGLAFTAGSQCLKPQITPIPAAVFATHDGGLSWRRTATLDMSVSEAAYSGSYAVAVGETGCRGVLATSTDAGLSWHLHPIPNSCQDGGVTAAGAVWLTCFAGGPNGIAYLASGSVSAPLRARHPLRGLANGAMFVVAANGDMYAIGEDHGANVLWVSDDEGRTWRGSLLQLPGV